MADEPLFDRSWLQYQVDPSLPPDTIEVRATPSPRQPAYDAVYPLIRAEGRDAWVNAFVWRCVEAALDAAGVPKGDPGQSVRIRVGGETQ